MTKTTRIAIIVAFAALAIVLFAVLQGSSDDDDSSESAATTTEETQAQQATVPVEPAEPVPEVIQVRNGAPVGGVKELSYTTGDRIRIMVELDQPQEDVHIHGYDIERLNPTKAAGFDFKADIEGIFELEAHGPNGDVVLAEIRVEPA
ncbi:hypothetical protein BH20ACT15_BH20ACT15_09920 [soil metagenome]